jgi:hypothetical protein
MANREQTRERKRHAGRKSEGGEKPRSRNKSQGKRGGENRRGGTSGEGSQGARQGGRDRRRSQGGRQGGHGGRGGQGGNSRSGSYGSGGPVDTTPRFNSGRPGTFEDLFADASKAVKAIGARLREIVQEVLPDAEERVYPTWKIALYNEPFEVCGIQLVGKHCNLYFSNGARMSDPAGLLEGSGRTIRHVKVKSTDDPPEDQLKGLILEAKKVGRG